MLAWVGFAMVGALVLVITLMGSGRAPSYTPAPELERPQGDATLSALRRVKRPFVYHSQWKEDVYMMGVLMRWASLLALTRLCRKGSPKLNGVFVEIGAHDGVTASNTLVFEESLGWGGLLIEANPGMFAALTKAVRPRSKKINAAVCSRAWVEFSDGSNSWVNGIVDELKGERYEWIKGSKRLKMKCQNMSSLLRQHDITSIDLFSLDVEGAEVDVLRTMDWSVKVHYWLIENDYKFREDLLKIAQIHHIMLEHNYVLCPDFMKLHSANECWEDPTFVD